jgi:hypothetical protein
MTDQVLKVLEVLLITTEGPGVTLRIQAVGIVPTAGWSDPRLDPRVYIDPPQDGIYEFDFVAERPDDYAAEVITPVSAELVLEHLPPDFAGVRVCASSNSIQKPQP